MSLTLNGAFWPAIVPSFDGSRDRVLAAIRIMVSHRVEGQQAWAGAARGDRGGASAAWMRIVCVARLLYIQAMRSATFPPIRVEPEVRAEVEAVLREGESLTQFIEQAVVSAAAWRRVQAEFVNRGEAAIERWKQEGGGRTVDEVMAGLQTRLDDAKRRAAERTGR
jgi:hypothetical protein